MNNLLSYCVLVEPRISASDKDLPVSVHAMKCQLCPSLFLTKNDLDQHTCRVHKGIKCHYCPKKFANHTDMYAHESSVHVIKCQFCPAKFMRNKDLDQHLNTDHKMLEKFWNGKMLKVIFR